MHDLTWNDVCKIVVVMAGGTFCVVAFMMLTANNPSADDFWRGIGSFGMGAGSAAAYHQWNKSHDAA